jgi:cytochrome b subunit of formate dehydrogenase
MDCQRRKRPIILLFGLALIAAAAGAGADEIDCLECHDEVVIDAPAHPDVTCAECHTNVTAAHEGRDLPPLTDDESCNECHLSDSRALGRSVHGGEVSCIDCHGHPHRLHRVDDPASAVAPVNQLDSCGDCHDEAPTALDHYRESVHGRALLGKGLDAAPGCSDCHGAHSVFAADHRRSLMGFGKLPETCGSCHGLLLRDWVDASAHGAGWQADDTDVPVCADCHASHGVADPHSPGERLAGADRCGDCHQDHLVTFRLGFHGKADRLGMTGSAQCVDCHTAHRNLPADDPRSSVHPDNRVETCATCHSGATAAFASFDPHLDPADPEGNRAVYVIWFTMMALLIAVFGFFGVHDALWLQRAFVGQLCGDYDDDDDRDERYVRRFSRFDVGTHVVVVVTFLALALTGLPLHFSEQAWAQTLVGLLGGPEVAALVHRIAAIGTFAYFAAHLARLLYRWVGRREDGLFWGPNSLVPQPQDFRDLATNLRHFVYAGDPAPGGRWNYIEKFDYLAVFWGVAVIGLSGLMLWFPLAFTAFLPGWAINAAYVVHSEEALLATGFIFVFHFFHTHLRPGIFPMDIAIFTGKLPVSRLRRERPLEYLRLVETGELDALVVDAPTPRERRRAYIFGSAALFIGVLLAAGILAALIGG